MNELTREEHGCVEVVRPLPAEREEKDGNHHGNGERQNDLEEGAEGIRTVYVRRFLKLIGNTRKELTHHEDVQAVFEAQATNRKNDQGRKGVHHVDGQSVGEAASENACDKLEKSRDIQALYTTDVEITEVHHHRKTNGFVRNDHGDNHEDQDDTIALEFEFSQEESGLNSLTTPNNIISKVVESFNSGKTGSYKNLVIDKIMSKGANGTMTYVLLLSLKA